MENKDLIPFSKELWETGEYEAIAGSKWIAIIYQITNNRIYGRVDDELFSWYLSGIFIQDSERWELMLRKKTKKVWIPLQEKFVFKTKEECERYFSRLLEPIKAIEVEI